MEIFEAIRTRRSIRRYTDKKIDDTVLNKILAAGMMAPSAGNEQPWHFVVVRDAQMRREISRQHPHAGALAEAPLAIVVCADTALERHPGFMPLDCAAATQNILLAATGLGLASVWVGVYPRQDRMDLLRRLLGVPAAVLPFSLLPLGYPAESKESEDRFTLSCVHQEHW
ncbi:MAG: nitroreductase family protein [Ignavibacteriales bacterium]|nr:nitroreductase family protein [Ignavibacteriales bacterium]